MSKKVNHGVVFDPNFNFELHVTYRFLLIPALPNYDIAKIRIFLLPKDLEKGIINLTLAGPEHCGKAFRKN